MMQLIWLVKAGGNTSGRMYAGVVQVFATSTPNVGDRRLRCGWKFDASFAHPPRENVGAIPA